MPFADNNRRSSQFVTCSINTRFCKQKHRTGTFNQVLCILYVITSYSIHYTKLYDIDSPGVKTTRFFTSADS